MNTSSKEEYFDELSPDGVRTGKCYPRSYVHREGLWHGCVHVWIVDPDSHNVLIQLRSKDKDAYGGMFDTSCAGHISAGDEPLESAIRELEEELGIIVEPSALELRGKMKQQHITGPNQTFIDNEWAWIYLLMKSIDLKDIKFVDGEVEAVEYIPLSRLVECFRMVNSVDSSKEEQYGVSDYLNLVPLDNCEEYLQLTFGHLL